MNLKIYINQFLLIGICSLGFADTIEEKLESLSQLASSENTLLSEQVKHTNTTLKELKGALEKAYANVQSLDAEDTDQAKTLLTKINDIKNQIKNHEKEFHKKAVELSEDEEGYSLWDQEEITLSQLVMEYGSNDYLYVVPNELSSTKLSLHAALPIPRESWSKLLEVILSQYGIGIKQINPFARKLYLLKQDLLGPNIIIDNKVGLQSCPDHSRIIYIFSPAIEHLKPAFHFFERFKDPKNTFVYSVGNKIAVVALKEEVQKLLKLYDTVWEEENEKVSKVLSLTRISSEEMQKILKSFFGSLADGNRFAMAKGGNELSVQPLKHENGLVLVGSKEIVKRAEEVVKETEAQLDDPTEMTVFWYSCRHSDPNDLAEVLEKVYQSLIYTNIEGEKSPPKESIEIKTQEIFEQPKPPQDLFDNPYTISPVRPPVVQPGTIKDQTKKSTTTNFIPYSKTGSLMMVVRKDTLERIKELLKKLDVPKKMVQMEVLLCEKKLNTQTNTGLNILKLGSAASNTHQTGIEYNSSATAPIRGLFEFFISRKKTSKNIPAFDITYNFLLSQEDVRINASPSILTINQTPATISIVEEISINNGAAPINNNENITFEKSFTREQFGITIVMTPTIHDPEFDGSEDKYSVTLETNVTFDTPKSDVDDRPKVNRRHIQNQVRVLDGQTVILGGLRRKTSEDKSEKIPFLGEIPGIAKLFGTSVMKDLTTEMFIFITPKVILDQKCDLERIRNEELKKRAGDIPEFIKRLLDAKNKKKRKLFEQSFELIFGNIND